MKYVPHPCFRRRGYRWNIPPASGAKKERSPEALALDRKIKDARATLEKAIDAYGLAVADEMYHFAKKRAEAYGWGMPMENYREAVENCSENNADEVELEIEDVVSSRLAAYLAPEEIIYDEPEDDR
jgi:hypothetical protein